MPPEEEQVKASKEAKFDSGLLSNDNMEELDNRNDLVTRKRSFMDKGEAIFTPEEMQEKEDVATGARTTLLARMKEENALSEADATNMQEQHNNHQQTTMRSAIAYAREKRKETFIAKAEYLAAYSKTGLDHANEAAGALNSMATDVNGQDNDVTRAITDSAAIITNSLTNPRGAFMRALTFTGTRANNARFVLQKTVREANTAAARIRTVSDEWDAKLTDYRNGTYKVRSRNYDRLFRKYYMLSRGKIMDQEHEGQNFKRAGDDGATEENTNAKNIAEYTGKYENPDDLVNRVTTRPFENTVSNIIPGKQLHAESKNTMNGTMKHHTQITMEGFGLDANGNQIERLAQEQAGEQPVQRIRFKLDNNLMGYKAKRQFTPQGTLAEDNAFLGKGDDAQRNMENMHLVADEKGANGEKLFSQKSSKVYELKKNGETVKGFFIDGEFISSDKNRVNKLEDADWWGRPKAEKLQKNEMLRTAIRRSDFFKHINAGTIQYYMNYDDETQTVEDKEVKTDFMNRRESIISFTSLGQALISGKFISTFGGLAGAAIPVAEMREDVPDDLVDETYLKYYDAHAKMLSFKDGKFGAAMGILSTASAAILPLTQVFGGSKELGNTIGSVVLSILGIVKNTKEFFSGLSKMWNRKAGEQFWPMLTDTVEAFFNTLSSASGLLKYIMSKAKSDQIKGIIGIVKDSVTALKDVINAFRTGFEKSAITVSDKRLDTVMQAAKGLIEHPEAGDVEEGVALQNNTQSSMFLKLARNRANREQTGAIIDTLSKAANIAATATGMGDKSAWFNPLSLPFKLASKVISFVGTGIDKFVGMLQRKGNVGIMLGDNGFDNKFKYPQLDQILKEETGIKNKHYLSDLVRVFTTIDLHCMLHKAYGEHKPAELRLAMDTIRPYYSQRDGETIPQFLQRVNFKRLLKATGAPKEWRTVLLNSIS